MPKHESFYLKKDLLSTVESLSDDEAGILIKHILNYCSDQTLELKDRFLQIAFIPFKICMNESWVSHNSDKEHWNWKGGITPLNRSIRNSSKIKKWRIDVFKRDNYTCQKCGVKNLNLQAHHIKEFSKYIDLRFEISNGITLCKKCHINHHKLLRNGKTNMV